MIRENMSRVQLRLCPLCHLRAVCPTLTFFPTFFYCLRWEYIRHESSYMSFFSTTTTITLLETTYNININNKNDLGQLLLTIKLSIY